MQKSKTFINIPALHNADLNTLTKTLGRPIDVEKTNYMGVRKTFYNFKKNGYHITVRIAQSRAKSFTISNPYKSNNPILVGQNLGYDLKRARILSRSSFNIEYKISGGTVSFITFNNNIETVQFFLDGWNPFD